jgi:tRNA A-37 threonylcarbamoyl transferase component Bud32
MIGEALGSYRLTAKLGSGAMGIVFLGEHQRLARRVAIKLLAPELVRDQRLLQRFFNEARAISLIRHPGIVDIFDCDVDAAGRAYMVMEHLEGETLADRLGRVGRLSWTAACGIAGQVADALAAAHDKGIVHRDLKPENVFLVGEPSDSGADATVKVLDFGVAKLLAVDAPTRLTMRGMLVGTPEYMSPEQCGGSGQVDHRADIYALGCVLFEMLSGLPPFVASDLQELIVAHQFRPAPSLAVAASEVPAWLADLVARMLSKEPGQRPPSMHQISETLRERRSPGLAASTTIAGRATVDPGAEREEPRQVARPTGDRPARVVRLGRRRVETAVVLATALFLTAGVWAARRSSGLKGTSAKATETPMTREAAPPAARSAPAAPAVDPIPTAAESTRTAPTGTAATVESVPRRPTPARAARPARRTRPGAGRPPNVVDTDGIVDL